jgi:DNA-binding MarR family transcriptional regulator
VVGRISRAARVLERGLQREYSRHDLQGWEFDILATLRRSGAPYELTAGALASSSMVTSGAITNRIDRLVARGLVTREVDPDNRRTVRIGLTVEGRRLVDEVLPHHVANEAALLEPLNAAERERLAGLLRKLLAGHEKRPAQD